MRHVGRNVIPEYNRMIGRRNLLRGSLSTGSLFLSGLHKLRWPEFASTQDHDQFRGGALLGVVEFSDEGRAPLNEALGAELDGRLFTDLSKLNPENSVTPTNSFYIRTRASKLLDTTKPWSMQFAGLIEKPFSVSPQNLGKMAQPMGLHLMECAGNSRSAHFGMLSVADWEGIPLQRLLENAKPKLQGTRVLISGFDRYASESNSSWPGASWIFTLEQLHSSRAFLATSMNGQSLTADHGAPVRLVVPGCYGCCCIKWVNEITLADEDAPATSQMQEYASRTMQTGVPSLAKDYRPALIDTSAMPIRIEKWSVTGKLKYRVVGIHWGGPRPIEGLEIQFNPTEDFVPVATFQPVANDLWSFWSQPWTPQKQGRYLIRLRLKGSSLATRRLDCAPLK
jgi:DMSO/TMAO reductase YedYZ molybdopterin-dependent catalytic subunit